VKQYPPIPAVGTASAPAFEGHLWLLELVEGSLLRFQLRESGAIRFGGERGVYPDDDAVPKECRRAVRHVRERLDREALRAAVDDVTNHTFVGRATHRERIDYDWERLPPFLGLDVWSADADAFRPPDAAEGIFTRLGLESANAVAREVRSRDFDPGSYEMPTSAWYDGPAAGVVIRDKRGNRAELENSGISEPCRDRIAADDASELVDAIATDRRFERVAARLRELGREPTVDQLRDRVLEDAYREEHGRLFVGEGTIDETALRSDVGRLASQFLG
jgi:hypothetical protein